MAFSFLASTSPMENLKLPKNFTQSRESMKAMMEAFKAGKFVANVIRKVFQVVAPASASRTPTSASTWALTSAVGGSRSIASKASTPGKALASAKSLTAPKRTSKEPIAISKSAESGSQVVLRLLL